MSAVQTDYLVVGAGAMGMAFTDELVARTDADVVLVDRRASPGGHWNDAYGFLRLHLPSATYGVASRPLGEDALDADGEYERASAAQVQEHFHRVLDERLLPSGRVRFLGMTEHEDGVLRSRLTGEATEVVVRRKVVDAVYLEVSVPATHVPSFEVGPGADVVPVGGLTKVAQPYDAYVVLGSGKTGMDAVLWLLDQGVPADRLRWVRPRDPWLLDRAGWQPLAQAGSILEGISLELEALAGAQDVDDLFVRLEGAGRLVRLDPAVTPTMFRCASTSRADLARLRSVRDVVRLGRVQRIEADRLVLEHGAVPTGPRTLHVDCTATGLRAAPPRPVFEPGRITLQQVRYCSPSFNAALVAYVEATRDDLDAMNRLCPPNPFPDTANDWLRVVATGLAAERAWSKEPDVQEWLEQCRLNLVRGMATCPDPRLPAAFERYVSNIKPGVARLRELLATTG